MLFEVRSMCVGLSPVPGRSALLGSSGFAQRPKASSGRDVWGRPGSVDNIPGLHFSGLLLCSFWCRGGSWEVLRATLFSQSLAQVRLPKPKRTGVERHFGLEATVWSSGNSDICRANTAACFPVQPQLVPEAAVPRLSPPWLAFSRGCSTETHSESKVQFSVPLSCGAAHPLLALEHVGARRGERGTQSGREPAAGKGHTHSRDVQDER